MGVSSNIFFCVPLFVTMFACGAVAASFCVGAAGSLYVEESASIPSATFSLDVIPAWDSAACTVAVAAC